MENNKVLIGKFIQYKRDQLEMTQDELAKNAGVSRATLWKIEKEEDGLNMSIDTLLKLLKAMNSNLEELANFVGGSRNLSGQIDALQTSSENKKIIEELISTTLK